MQLLMSLFVGLLLSVNISAEPLLEGRVRLESGQPAVGVQVRLFDLTNLHQSVGTTTDETGHFTLSLPAAATRSALPQGFALGQNYPNPFNPSTIIPYQIPTAAHVRLAVFNLLGQRIATLVDAERAAGMHTAQWDATDAAGRAVGAGVYIYQLSSDGMKVSRRMVLIDGQAGTPAAAAAGPMQASALERVEADSEVYGLTVSGAGLVAYVDPAFRVGVDKVEIVVEEHSGRARMKRTAGGILGDVDNDGQVDASDALYVLLYIEDNSIVLPNNGDISLGDLNEDGTVDFADAVLFVRYLADPSDPALPTGIGDDHGNTLSEATAVSLGSSTAGSLSEEDIDYFVIEISNEGTLLATTTGDTNTKGSILDSSGNVLASDSYSGTGSNFMVAVPVSPGTYYIQVEGRFSRETGDYTLEVLDNSPDLVVESPSASPSSLSAGDWFTLRATVRNQGAGDAASTTLTWYRSDDASIDPTDIVLDTDYVSSLDAAQTSEESARIAAPEDAGTYYYGACVESVAGESNTDNNCSSPGTVTVEPPDLVVESLSASPSSLSAGDRFTLQATVRNQGAGDAASTTLTWYRSDDASIDPTDIVLDTDYVSSLDAAQTSEESARIAAPEDAGTYYYGACVESVAGESNTDNNCSSPGTVTVEQNDDGDGDGGDGGGGDSSGSGTTYGVGEALPNYPSGFFIPAILNGASFSSSGGRTTLSFNNGGFVKLQDGTRYTCIASGGCSIESGRVTAGTISVTSGDGADDDGDDESGDGGSDDHPNTRPLATRLAPGSSLAGAIETGGDVDYFKVQVGQAGTLTVYTTGSLDTKGTLEDNAGSTLESDDDSGNGTNFRIERAVTAGSYYVKVEAISSSHTGSYTIHASVSSSSSDGGDSGDGDSGDDGAAVTGRITECSGTRDSFSGLVNVTISGTVQAHRSVSFLLVTGYANGSLVGTDFLDDMSAGQSQNFSISGIAFISGTRFTCTASTNYVTSGSAKLTVGDPDSPEQVRVQGSLSPSSSLINRKQQLQIGE